MPRLQAKTFATPVSLREMPRARIASVTLDDATIGYCSFGPGWRWSSDVGPLMGASSCPIRHIGYVISGTIHAVMDDGQTLDIGRDSVFEIPPGHDKWVVGDEPWVTLDWGASGRAIIAAMDQTGTRTLATVMFTDIVDSTARAQEIGMRRGAISWRVTTRTCAWRSASTVDARSRRPVTASSPCSTARRGRP